MAGGFPKGGTPENLILRKEIENLMNMRDGFKKWKKLEEDGNFRDGNFKIEVKQATSNECKIENTYGAWQGSIKTMLFPEDGKQEKQGQQEQQEKSEKVKPEKVKPEDFQYFLKRKIQNAKRHIDYDKSVFLPLLIAVVVALVSMDTGTAEVISMDSGYVAIVISVIDWVGAIVCCALIAFMVYDFISLWYYMQKRAFYEDVLKVVKRELKHIKKAACNNKDGMTQTQEIAVASVGLNQSGSNARTIT